MNKRLIMVVALAATSVAQSTSNLFAQSESLAEESIQHVEKATGDIAINEVNFPDAVFRDFIRTGSDYDTKVRFDTNGDGILSSYEMNNVVNIGVYQMSTIKNLKGIEHFPNLRELNCGYTGITSLDISKNTALQLLHCYHTGITSLDVSKNTALRELYCHDTGITSLDVSNNSALERLDCYRTGITSLDVSNNPALWKLVCAENLGITSIDVSNNPALRELVCHDTGITSIDVSNNIALEQLHCQRTGITSLDVSNNPALEWLECSNTKITSLDLSKNPALTRVNSINNSLAWFHVGDNANLEVYTTASTIDLGTIDRTFNIQEAFPGIDLNRIQNISGATLDKTTGIISGYADGTPITYTYDCGISKNGTNTLNVTLNFAIKGISSIIINDNLDKVYDGQAVVEPKNITTIGSTGNVTFEWYTADGILLTSAPVNVGSYKVKAILAGDENFLATEVEKAFDIIKASSTITINDDLNKTYDGQSVIEPSVTKTGSTGAVSFEWYEENGTKLQTAPTDAGNYKVKAFLAEDGNFTSAEVEKDFTIGKASSTIIINDDLNKVYDGQAVVEPSVTTTGSTGAVTFKWYMADDTPLQTAPVNIGSYKVKAILADDANHIGAEVEKDFTIGKAASTITINDDLNKVYDGTAVVEPTDIVTTGSTETVTFEWYTADGTPLTSAPVNAGSYIVKAILAEDTNYAGIEVEKEFTISQASSSVTITVELDKVYDGQAVSEPQVSVTGSTGAITYEWYKKEESATRSVTWTQLTEAPREVGSYKVVVTVAGDGNFEAAIVEKEFSISGQATVVPTPGTSEETTTIPGQEVTGVQTGDGTQVGLWTMLVGLSTGMMIFFRRKNRKEEV